jgi:hypothetical protein
MAIDGMTVHLVDFIGIEAACLLEHRRIHTHLAYVVELGAVAQLHAQAFATT